MIRIIPNIILYISNLIDEAMTFVNKAINFVFDYYVEHFLLQRLKENIHIKGDKIIG